MHLFACMQILVHLLILGKFSFLYHMFLYRFAVTGADHGAASGVSGAIEIGQRRLLLKGKERETPLVYIH